MYENAAEYLKYQRMVKTYRKSLSINAEYIAKLYYDNEDGLLCISAYKIKLEKKLTKEYAKEFLCEGQLWFYYKRMNTSKIQSGATNSYITMDNARYVPGLPDSEIKNRN